MGIAELNKKPVADSLLGIDASTRAIGFCVIEDGKPKHYGKLDLEGTDTHERCGDANGKVYALLKQYDVDAVAIEEAIYVNNRSVVIDLAKVFGSIIGVAEALGKKVHGVHPSTWMSYIDNPVRNSKELKAKVREEYPDKSKTWYKNRLREWRKQRTLTHFNDLFDIELEDDDVGDSFGVAWYAYNELTERS